MHSVTDEQIIKKKQTVKLQGDRKTDGQIHQRMADPKRSPVNRLIQRYA